MNIKKLNPLKTGSPIEIQSSFETLTTLNTRRSTLAKQLSAPGPDDEQIKLLIRLASRVPDHGKLNPWRFLVIKGKKRQKLGEIISKIKAKEFPDLHQEILSFEKNRFLRAPVIIGIISAMQEHPKIPKWEQILSAGAVCQNLLIGCNALGLAAQWLTEWYAYNEEFLEQIGIKPNEKIAGFIYIGTASSSTTERTRPDYQSLITYL